MTDSKIFDGDPDRLLVELATRGDASAFEELLLRHEQFVFRMILRITKVREDAEDQTQETFIRAYQNLGSFRGTSKFRTWLAQIAVNQALMCLRRRRNDVLSFLHTTSESGDNAFILELADSSPDPEQEWIRVQLGHRLEREINRLPQQLRSAFVLRYVQECSGTEAATSLGVSIGAIKSRVIRARRTIRQRLTGSTDTSICA
jgi:RNA polymerase sigma-70 factor (ECF subfamily)